MNQRPFVVTAAAVLVRVLVLVPSLFMAACGDTKTPTAPTPTPTPLPTPLPTPVSEVEYTLTFTASPSCSFPAEIEKRTYSATVREYAGGLVAVLLSGAEFELGFSSFVGQRHGETLDFDITFQYVNGVIEKINQAKQLFYDGTAHATISEGKISGTYSGRMALFDSPRWRIYDRATYDCTARDHRIEFVPR